MENVGVQAGVGPHQPADRLAGSHIAGFGAGLSRHDTPHPVPPRGLICLGECVADNVVPPLAPTSGLNLQRNIAFAPPLMLSFTLCPIMRDSFGHECYANVNERNDP